MAFCAGHVQYSSLEENTGNDNYGNVFPTLGRLRYLIRRRNAPLCLHTSGRSRPKSASTGKLDRARMVVSLPLCNRISELHYVEVGV